jgi:hypothetical protein
MWKKNVEYGEKLQTNTYSTLLFFMYMYLIIHFLVCFIFSLKCLFWFFSSSVFIIIIIMVLFYFNLFHLFYHYYHYCPFSKKMSLFCFSVIFIYLFIYFFVFLFCFDFWLYFLCICLLLFCVIYLSIYSLLRCDTHIIILSRLA